MTDHAEGNSRPTNPDVRHERSDIETSGIWKFLAGLTLVATALLVGSTWMMTYLRNRELAAKRSTLPAPASEELPPEPRLEGFTWQHEVGRHWPGSGPVQAGDEERRLQSYGWVDRKEGLVHIPISEAMKLALQEHKLPARME
jgi:hypothetical protein